MKDFANLFGTQETSPPVLAQLTVPTDVVPRLEQLQPDEVIRDAVSYAVIAALLLCIAFIFYGGISFILSGGQEERVKQAVGTIRYAIIGLIVAVISVGLLQIAASFFQVPVDIVTYQDVFDRIRELGELFGGNTTSNYNL